MIWSFIAFLSLVQLASSTPDLTFTIRNSAKRAKGSESSSLTGNIELECGLTSHDCENRPEHKLNNILPGLDQTHVTRIFESNKNGPYFWENKLFRSNTHVGFKAINQRKKDMSQLPLMEQVEIIQEECLELRKNLKLHQEPGPMKGHDILQNAEKTLGCFLEQISDSLIELFYQEDLEKRKFLMLNGPLQQEHWQSLVFDVLAAFNQFKSLLLKFEAQHKFSQGKGYQKFIGQVFSMVNFLIKNNLIEEKSLKDLIREEQVKKLISSHIIKIFSKETILGLEFHESLLKSKSTEHLAFVFKFFEKDDFKHLEYDLLEQKIEVVKKSWENGLLKIKREVNSFLRAGFARDDEKAYERSDEIRNETLLVLNLLTGYLNKSTDFRSFLDDDGRWWEYQDHTYGIAYDMVSFVMKYEPELFKESFDDEKSVDSFHLKMNILDSALKYQRSAEMLDFILENGFWTSELSFSHSRHQIPLAEAKNMIPTPNLELGYFKDTFSCYTYKDFELWKEIFKKSSMDRIEHNMDKVECINLKKLTDSSLNYFGTNFKLNSGDKFEDSADKNIVIRNPMISKLFITNLYSWIERFEVILDHHQKNHMLWSEIENTLESRNEQEKPLEIRNDLVDWVKNSDIIRLVRLNTVNQFITAEQVWDKIRGKLEQLNKIVRDYKEDRPLENDIWNPEKIRNPNIQEDKSFRIPKINFQS